MTNQYTLNKALVILVSCEARFLQLEKKLEVKHSIAQDTKDFVAIDSIGQDYNNIVEQIERVHVVIKDTVTTLLNNTKIDFKQN